ncbi:magnesium transporter CorA family protein [Pseudomonas kuykendallii]|uniref:Magnesium transport protein CorA n=1 Tax=Pseudomonas kuykendallii TaxID=1007099 RepID=A0A1H2RXI7_9PSED|nr:magnesium transporter CorA family protein [Pseudomonas kuykendallii]MCQ4270363.1 magnesium transporter CorA family protein [Pseudomonas kuykendallii]SDW24191.1 magnesium transporter [Pseudomonas kuykendallii]
MITYYLPSSEGLRACHPDDLGELPAEALWIDLLNPTPAEEKLVEKALGMGVPTREEMAEIEDSSRFYEENGALYMTTSVVTGITEKHPRSEESSFVLSERWLVTVRYSEMTAFRTFVNKAARQADCHQNSDMLFASLLDSMVDRIADVLEELQAQLNSLSQHIFSETRERAQEKADLQRVIKDLGRYNSLLAKLNESLLSIGRQITYVRQAGNGWLSEAARTWLKSSERDVRSLNDYQTKMSGEIVFLLDVTLGLINIEQNSIIKVFSIAAVLFLPPTLVGTVYGMNFKVMPELDWTLGYPMALGMMVGSALLSYALFKYKGWL